MPRYKIDPYLLSEEENILINNLVRFHKPLQLAKETGIPRSTVYFLLEKLKKRGFVFETNINGKRTWSLIKSSKDIIDNNKIEQNPFIKIYRTKDEINQFLNYLLENKNDRLKGFSGDNISTGWKKNVGIKKIIEFNNVIKNESLISELITSNKYFKKQIEEMGTDWAQSHSDRPCEFHIIPKKYSAHSGQIFMKSDSIYFIDMNKPLIIEIRESSIKTMMEFLFSFIKDNTPSTNINEYIEKILKEDQDSN